MLNETPLGVEFRRSFSQAPFEYTRSFRRRNSAKAHMLAVDTRAGARAGLVYASPGNPRGSVAVVAQSPFHGPWPASKNLVLFREETYSRKVL
ncbi:uncharacterized protein DS421_11g335350 [Arachis hypogaea]|nr:uncharacterized protein DS421_11g335350 [Arachis hypogaea]